MPLLKTYQHLSGACKDTSSIMARVKSAKLFIFGAIAIEFLTALGLATRRFTANRSNTAMTKTYAKSLRERDDSRPTIYMAGNHAIANRRQISLRETILPVFGTCVP